MRKLSAFRFTYPSTRAPDVFPAKEPSRRRLSADQVALGRHEEKRQTRTSETPSAVSACTTSAQAPRPAKASTTPTTPPSTVPAISRSWRLRNLGSRVSSAICVDENDVMRNRIDVAANSGL